MLGPEPRPRQLSQGIDLDLDLTPRTRGRASRPLSATYVRDLTPADIALLGTERAIQPKPIQRLRDSHHALARTLALGYGPNEASALTGYSVSRISILQSDPAFMELLSFYKDDASEEFLAIKAQLDQRMMVNALTAEAILTERLEEEPEKFKAKDLNEVAISRADRLGYGPKSTQVNVHVDMAETLRLARERAARATPSGAPPLQPQPGGDPPLLEHSPTSSVVNGAPEPSTPAPAGSGLEQAATPSASEVAAVPWSEPHVEYVPMAAINESR